MENIVVHSLQQTSISLQTDAPASFFLSPTGAAGVNDLTSVIMLEMYCDKITNKAITYIHSISISPNMMAKTHNANQGVYQKRRTLLNLLHQETTRLILLRFSRKAAVLKLSALHTSGQQRTLYVLLQHANQNAMMMMCEMYFYTHTKIKCGHVYQAFVNKCN